MFRIVRGRTLFTAEFKDKTVVQDIMNTVFEFEWVFGWKLLIKNKFINSLKFL